MGIYWAGPEWLERGGTRTRPRQRLCCVGGSQSFRLNLANLSCHVTKHWSYHEDIGSPSIPLVSFSTADHGLRPNVRATLNAMAQADRVLGPAVSHTVHVIMATDALGDGMDRTPPCVPRAGSQPSSPWGRTNAYELITPSPSTD